MLFEAQHNKTKITKVFNFWQIVVKYTCYKHLFKDTSLSVLTLQTTTHPTDYQYI